MRLAGQIVEWDDDRGFGFVVTNGSPRRIFFHVSQLQDRRQRPAAGDRITYTTSQDERGRLQARDIARQRLPSQARRKRGGSSRARVGVAALALIVLGAAVGILPAGAAGLYAVASGLSFMAYRADKKAARKRAWRIPEQTLHLLDLAGGWPGALIAQQRYHHKTVKQPFQALFWLSAAANVAGMVWLLQSGLAAQMLPSLVG